MRCGFSVVTESTDSVFGAPAEKILSNNSASVCVTSPPRAAAASLAATVIFSSVNRKKNYQCDKINIKLIFFIFIWYYNKPNVGFGTILGNGFLTGMARSTVFVVVSDLVCN